MKRQEEKKERGIFERPAGSGCWWVNYYASGKQHREKAGRKSDAIALYQKRKADARRKLKLPELVPSKVVRFCVGDFVTSFTCQSGSSLGVA